ncbi:NO-inducible flavohemoprotein [Immundisolibacter sp.]|uniref:NO-inducible flavohemoprotein n=1 Tax=Immundisolibacter sp. TaxID=1934948 RepID=UPI003562F023
MLSEHHRQQVKATVPLLEAGGEALTRHFYGVMLSEHPEVRPLFNQAHQASGAQPRALANGILQYARHIDRLDTLGPLVGQIVQKHVSLQVLPEQYPIVGSCLLRAIREVLGPDIATDAVIEAWAAAYEQLADLLIGAEEDVYAAAAATPGGWRGARRFEVVRKVPESVEITSLYLRPADGGAVMPFKPGQYIGIRLAIDGQEVRRNYSLSAPPNGSTYRISVKREPGGVVSNHLHDALGVGAAIDLFPPAGEFVLAPGERPLALISGGVGITPTLPMLHAAHEQRRPVTFVHFARNAAVHAFRDWVDDLVARSPQARRFYCHEQAGTLPVDANGRACTDLLARWLPQARDMDAYFIGPPPFMAAVKRALGELGVPPAQMHWEFFGPAAALET